MYVCSKQQRPLSIAPEEFFVHAATNTFTLHFGQAVFSYRLCSYGSIPTVEPDDRFIKLQAEEVECLQVASAFRQQHDPCGSWRPVFAHDEQFLVRTGSASFDFSKKASFAVYYRQWPFSSMGYISTRMIFIATLAAAGSFYGGLHLLAWNAPSRPRPKKCCGELLALSLQLHYL
jgi:hypothetical protein